MKTAKKYGRRYPWEKWFRSQRFSLIRGVDFEIRTYGMAAMIRNQASDRKIPVSVEIVGEDRIEVGPPKKRKPKGATPQPAA